MWYLIVALIFITLTTNDTKYLFISLLVVWVFSFLEVLFNSFAYLKVRLVCLFNWFIGVLCIVDVNSLSYICSNKWKWKSLSRVWLFVTLWAIQSMEFSRSEYWSGSPFPSLGDLPNLGIESGSPALQANSLPAELPRKLIYSVGLVINSYNRLE